MNSKNYDEFERFYKKVIQKELTDIEKTQIKEKLQYFLKITELALEEFDMH